MAFLPLLSAEVLEDIVAAAGSLLVPIVAKSLGLEHLVDLIVQKWGCNDFCVNAVL
jgi:hypothetical protein